MIEQQFSVLTEVIGWTLVHSIWIGALGAGLLFLLLNVFRKEKPVNLYLLSTFTLTVVLAGVGAAFAYELQEIQLNQATIIQTGHIPETTSVEKSPVTDNFWSALITAWLSPVRDFYQSHLQWVVLFWFSGAFIWGVRLTGGYLYLIRLSRKGLRLPGTRWTDLTNDLSAELMIDRPVRLRISSFVSEPLTIWHFRPLILVPAGILSGLSPVQIETILLHELAHIRRADFLINMLQSVAEVLLFFHPAIWWISGRIRTLREECCDDMVIATGRDVHTYAEALTSIYSIHHSSKPRFTMSAIGNKGQFTARIHRMFGILPHRTSPGKNLITTVFLALSLSAMAFYYPSNHIISVIGPEDPYIVTQSFQTPVTQNFQEPVAFPAEQPVASASVIPPVAEAQPQPEPVPAAVASVPVAEEKFEVIIYSEQTEDDLENLQRKLSKQDIDLDFTIIEVGHGGKLTKVAGNISFPDGKKGNFNAHGQDFRIVISREYKDGKGGSLQIYVSNSNSSTTSGSSVVVAPSPPQPPRAVSGNVSLTAPTAPTQATVPPPPPPPGVTEEVQVDGNTLIRIRPEADGEPLFILDGKKLLSGEGIKSLNSEDIEAISVLKGESATKEYGDEGKNGVIIITTKK